MRNPSLAVITAAVLLTAPIAAQAECMMISGLERDALFEKYKDAAVMVQTTGPDQSRCEDSGTGLLVSDDGLIVTAKHVIPDACPGGLDITVRFARDPTKAFSVHVVKESGLDAALLQVDDVAGWKNEQPSVCSPSWSDREAAKNEEFIWFGRQDPEPLAQRYVGAVMSSSSTSGMAPMQMVCAVINPSDSGGPIISAKSGSLVGVMVRRVMADANGRVLNSRGLILPANLIAGELGLSNIVSQNCDSIDSVPFLPILPIRSEYQFIVDVPRESSTDPIVRIVKPYSNFRFSSIDKVSVSDTLGKTLVIDKECSISAENCVQYSMLEQSITVVMRFRGSSKVADQSRIVSISSTQTLVPDNDLNSKISNLNRREAIQYLSDIQSPIEYMAINGANAPEIVSLSDNGEMVSRKISRAADGSFSVPQNWGSVFNSTAEFRNQMGSPIRFIPQDDQRFRLQLNPKDALLRSFEFNDQKSPIWKTLPDKLETQYLNNQQNLIIQKLMEQQNLNTGINQLSPGSNLFPLNSKAIQTAPPGKM